MRVHEVGMPRGRREQQEIERHIAGEVGELAALFRKRLPAGRRGLGRRLAQRL